MADPGLIVKAKEQEKAASAAYDEYKKLHYQTGDLTDVRCQWDIGANTIGPGGPVGKYIRQCKKIGTTKSPAGLCIMHERKRYMMLARAKTTASMALSKRGVRRTATDSGIVDPRSVLATLKQWNEHKASSIETCTAFNKTDAVYTLADAMCAMGHS